jgi:outer membrane protein assembly factor BamB
VQAARRARALTPDGDPSLRAPPPVGAGADASNAPLFRGDAARTGRSAVAGPGLAARPSPAWAYHAFFPNRTVAAANASAALILSSPAIGADGSIYFGTLDGYLYALFGDGAPGRRRCVAAVRACVRFACFALFTL